MSVKNKRKFPLSAILWVIVFIALILTWLFYHTTLFVTERPAPAGYLSAEEYRLYDPGESGKSILRSLTYDDHHTYLFSPNGPYHTSRGIRPGSTWEEFLEAYGDCQADSLSAYSYGEEDYSDSYYDTHYAYDMTVREFDEQYIKTGLIDPETEELDIRFSFNTQGTKIIYTPEERDEMYDNYYASYFSFGFIHGSFYPSYHEVSMSFSFYPPTELEEYDTPVLYSISLYKW